MATEQKKTWAEMDGSDDDDRSPSPEFDKYAPQQQAPTAQMTVEYKLQPTGEQIAQRDRHQRKPVQKKPLLTINELKEQINQQEHSNVYLHCFGVNGSAEAFKKQFESKVHIVKIVDANNTDRDNSLDLQFGSKEESIKFLSLVQSTTIEGRSFRVKFGRNLKREGGDRRGEHRERRDYRENREHREPKEPRDFKSTRGGERKGEFYGENNNRNNNNRQPNEFPKKTFNHAAEKKEEVQSQVPAAENQPPAEPFRPRGFVNSKKESNVSTTTGAASSDASIHCVDLNAKILQKQAKLDQEKKEEEVIQRESSKKREGSKRREGSKKRGGSKKREESKNKEEGNRRQRKESGKVVESAKKETSKGRNTNNAATTTTVYVKKAATEAEKAPVKAATTTTTTSAATSATEQKQSEVRSESKKRLRLPSGNVTDITEEWSVVPSKKDSKKHQQPHGQKKDDKKPRNNGNKAESGNTNNNKGSHNNNNNKQQHQQPKEKQNTKYERKEPQHEPKAQE